MINFNHHFNLGLVISREREFTKIFRDFPNFPGNYENWRFRELSGNEIYGNFPGFPGRDFPGISPIT